ncbi:uncharacterized protein CANTADRAFT_27206 [Suhomyces tanzawaensis NRRL Y-17324]|uniref:Uncharacterized protein n=1 Tax=Suhomyces tanzawaensis NRRL Y-17324 TaxID=984487 RepID=A0A1E4SD04_9ASCO|nr:uncharacterized protein CANTADRAFT_27206 [Suhomyces tanzawaensis NRRL Y-17324]ODV77348.1 hypothetical protein CANTADRAFT_27206 [Suhomyces tanzawaensis NRRL Y-17324]
MTKPTRDPIPVKSFQSQITDQTIFKTYIGFSLPTELSPLFPAQKVVTTTDGHVYYANYNIVRHCVISPTSTAFRTLNFTTDFEIHAMYLNALETLLALVGDTKVTVVEIPGAVDDVHKTQISGKHYNIGNLKGRIVKVLWQTIVAKDCLLVILTDYSVIRSFDLSLSASFPQLEIDLKAQPEFEHQNATSISFGSSVNVQGSLTLYVSSEKEVYAFYPFLAPTSRLACSMEGLDYALDETKAIIETIESRFSFQSITDSISSPLTLLAISQYEFFLHLRNQFETGVPLQTENRKLKAFSTFNLKRLTHSLHSDYKPKLQGPLSANDGESLIDIQSMYSNKNFTTVVALASKFGEAHLQYYAQLKPLIMKLNCPSTETPAEPIAAKLEAESNAKKQVPKKSDAYVKPSKGFGFIAFSDDEDDVTDTVDNFGTLSLTKVKVDNDRAQREKEFEKEEFNSLTLLEFVALDYQFPTITSRNDFALLNYSEEGKRLFLKAKDDGHVIKADDFLSDLSNSLISDTSESDPNNFSPIQYTHIKISRFSALSCAVNPLLDNDVSEYLIVLSDSLIDNLKVYELKLKTEQKDVLSEPTIVTKPSKEPSVSTGAYSRNSDTISGELRLQLQELGNFDEKALSTNINSEVLSKSIGETTDDLSRVHLVSTQALNQLANLAALVAKSLFNATQKIDELQLYVNMLRNISEKVKSPEQLEHLTKKAQNIAKKQEELEKRQTQVKSRLSIRILQLKKKQSLPLSRTEKAWFKEINALNAMMKKEVDGTEQESLPAKIESYKAQVRALVNPSLSDKNVFSALEELKQRELAQVVARLKVILKQDSEQLNRVNTQLQELPLQQY